jgi:hypothetical protein
MQLLTNAVIKTTSKYHDNNVVYQMDFMKKKIKNHNQSKAKIV